MHTSTKEKRGDEINNINKCNGTVWGFILNFQVSQYMNKWMSYIILKICIFLSGYAQMRKMWTTVFNSCRQQWSIPYAEKNWAYTHSRSTYKIPFGGSITCKKKQLRPSENGTWASANFRLSYRYMIFFYVSET